MALSAQTAVQSQASRPVPIARQDWVTEADYPREAAIAGAQGDVRFALEVDGAGAPIACAVTQSSGSAALDAHTCALLRARARFKPARDVAGQAASSHFSGGVGWRLPPEPVRKAVPATNWNQLTRFVMDEAGAISDCKTTVSGGAGQTVHLCGLLQGAPTTVTLKYRGRERGPVTFLIGFIHQFEGQPRLAGRFERDGFTTIGRIDFRFTLDPSGEPKRCERTGKWRGNVMLWQTPCEADILYETGSGKGGEFAPRSGRVTIWMATDGKPPSFIQ